jgi:type III secretory pathway component EscU
MSGFGKIFSTKTLVETFFSALKIILISLVIWYVMSFALSTFPSHPEQCNLSCYRLILQTLTLKMVTLLIPLFIVLAALDYMLQKHEFTKKQMMTKDEAKRDHKDSQGDPVVKSAQRSFQYEMMFDDFEDRVKNSRIIITDYNKGVSLSYNPALDELPVLFCKCSGGMLSKLLSVGRQENIKIVEETTLTHALFEDGKIDTYIPSHTVKRVAQLMK